jgi:phosphoserine phosphatase
LIRYTDEFRLYSKIAADLGKAQCWHKIPIHPFRLFQLLKIKGRLDKLYKLGKEGKESDYVEKMYKVFNKEVIAGLSTYFIHQSADSYAKEACKQLDSKILRPLQELRKQGRRMGILSAGYKYGIRITLKEAHYEDVFDVEDIVAENLKEDKGKAIGFPLDIYKNKFRFLVKEFLTRREFKPKETAYIGNSKDDEPCFEYLSSEGGQAIISFFASEDFKQHCTQKYKAFAPEDEDDFLRYLQSLH